MLASLVSLQVPLVAGAIAAGLDLATMANTEVFSLSMLPEVLVVLVLFVTAAILFVFISLVIVELSASYETR